MSDDQNTAEAVCNEALDEAGVDFTIGNLEEGSGPAQRLLRTYMTSMRQLLRTAHWTFARKQGPLQLVADASGQTSANRLVPGGFLYSYSMPTDCLKVRFIPANYWNLTPPAPAANITPFDGDAPLNGAMGQPPWAANRMLPSRFLIANDPNYVPDGASNTIRGVSPTGQTLICSNVQFAQAVYTAEIAYPNMWDELFRGAFVAVLAAKVALPLANDKKFGMQMRNNNIAIAKEKIREARSASANETWANADIQVDWLRVRMTGGYTDGYGFGGGFGAGAGYLFGGYDGIWFGDNSAAY